MQTDVMVSNEKTKRELESAIQELENIALRTSLKIELSEAKVSSMLEQVSQEIKAASEKISSVQESAEQGKKEAMRHPGLKPLDAQIGLLKNKAVIRQKIDNAWSILEEMPRRYWNLIFRIIDNKIALKKQEDDSETDGLKSPLQKICNPQELIWALLKDVESSYLDSIISDLKEKADAVRQEVRAEMTAPQRAEMERNQAIAELEAKIHTAFCTTVWHNSESLQPG
jgi:hypothetical protein